MKEIIMRKVQVGNLIKALDFGAHSDSYIVGTVTFTHEGSGRVEGTIIKRVIDDKDVTGEYDDGTFSTYQNGESILDKSMGSRLFVINI